MSGGPTLRSDAAGPWLRTRPPAPPAPPEGDPRLPFLVLLAGLLCWYGTWLAVFWPGVLGEDSAAILMEVDRPDTAHSGKTVFWYFFVRAFYGTTGLVEVPIGIALAVGALVFARILSWTWAQGLRKTCVFGLLCIAAAPHMVVFLGTLYPDGLFAVGATGLLFEVWRCMRRRTVDAAALAMLALTLPFAAFARSNGWVFLAPALLLLFFVQGRGRIGAAVVIAAWCGLVQLGTLAYPSRAQGALLPLVMFETVHFLQPQAMHALWQTYPNMNDPWVHKAPKLSPATLELLQRHGPLDNMRAYSDPAYWDMLIFHPEGPRLLGLPAADQELLVREFWRYNLWQNLPLFAGHRVTVFLTAAMAEGGFPALDYARYVLPRTRSASELRRFEAPVLERAFSRALRATHRIRWLAWAPWLGLALLAWGCRRSIARRDMALGLVAWPMAVQLGGIALLASAGEYRYLLPFFTLPLLLLPAFVLGRVQATAPGGIH